MEAFFVSTGIVTLGEMGDKTQLLAMMLAARYRRAGPILWGILVATAANHAGAAAIGGLAAQAMGPDLLRWVIGLSFLAMAVWMLVPDKPDDAATLVKPGLGIFATTALAFFMAEMGDKTQIATVALAARYVDFWQVVAGTTLGMMLANVPAVLLGDHLAGKVPMQMVHSIAALLFALLGGLTLLNVGQLF